MAKDSKELANACSMFVETATKDYRQEFSELTKISGDLTNGAADILQDMSVAKDAGAVTGE